MVTRAQIEKLASRIEKLEVTFGAPPDGPIEYEVQLLWIQDDGSLLDSDGTPYVHNPDDIHIGFN